MIDKVMRIGTIKLGGRFASVYVHARTEARSRTDVRSGAMVSYESLSITGVIGPLPSGNALGGCGQIDMEFKHRNLADDDSRYGNPISPTEIKFAKGWNAVRWLDLLDVWKRWHMNDLRSECEHQRQLGWKYDDHHDPKTFQGEACPTCGYRIGSAWLIEPMPLDVSKFIESLPDADRKPAWI